MMLMQRSGTELLKLAFQGQKTPERDLLLIRSLPQGPFKQLDISHFNVVNRADNEIKNCSVWFPAGYWKHVRPTVTFDVIMPIENCHFFFFRVPDRRANLKFVIQGSNHSMVMLSNRRMALYVRLSDKNSRLIVGEDVFIGGGTVALDNTTLTVGAGGLWSDGVLVQGTDSHGIVDLDSMSIVNGGPKHIMLKRRVWLGRQTKIMKNLTIGEGSIVATGALVSKDVPKACAVAGVPAKIVRQRVSWTHKQYAISAFDRRELTKLREQLGDTEQPKSPSLFRRALRLFRR